MGVIRAVNISKEKGTRKKNIASGLLVAGHGLEGDAHAGPGNRQVSLLAWESIQRARSRGLDVGPGDFAENLTTEGIDLAALKVGTKLAIGPQAVGEVTQIGKACHAPCEIRRLTGDCVMPREGIFIRVLVGGPVKVGDRIEVLES